MRFIPCLTHKYVWHDATKMHYLHSIKPESFYQQWFGFPGLYPDEVSIRFRCKDAFYHHITQGGDHDILYHFKSRIFTCYLDFYDLTEGWQRVKHQPVSAQQLIENCFTLQSITIDRVRPLETKRS